MPITVFSYEAGLLYKNGVFVRRVGPGRYSTALGKTIEKVDMRDRQVVLGGQEILTQDHISLRISIVIGYRVSDPEKHVLKVQNAANQLYVSAQLALRVAIAARSFEEILVDKGEVGEAVLDALKEPAARLGIEPLAVSVRDITLPPALKKAYNEAQTAKQEGLAALERARGESATLRNLANSARMLENNPELLALRTLQAMEKGSGNVLLLNRLFEPKGIQPKAPEPSVES